MERLVRRPSSLLPGTAPPQTPSRPFLLSARIIDMLRRSPLLLALLPVWAAAAPVYESHEPRLLLEAPSEVAVGETVVVGVLFQDRWGPEGPEVPSAGVDHVGRFEVSSTDPAAALESRLTIPAADQGRAEIDIVFSTPGIHHVDIAGSGGVAARSNPIRVLRAAPDERVYWGDLHGHLHTPGAGHSGQLPLADYRRYVEEGLDWAEHVSRLDFAAFTPHLQTAGGLARAAGREGTPWTVLLDVIQERHRPGEFVVFPGFEWQGDEGDHCVIYPGPGALEAPGDLAALCEATKRRGGLVTAHAVYLPSEFAVHSDALAAVEVTRDSRSTEEVGVEALRSGMVPAFLGCSDTHGGALGSTSITGVRAKGRTRADILQAIRDGRTWATNGERILLDFSVDVTGSLPRLRVSGVATAPVDRIEVYRNGTLLADARGFGDSLEFRFTREDDDLLRVECVSAPVTYHARVVQTSANRYDPGHRDLAVSSPVEVRLQERHFNASYLARGGQGVAPGGALLRVRDAWANLGPLDDRGPRARLPRGRPLPDWERSDLAPLESASRELSRQATKDAVLLPLASTIAAAPKLAEALRVLRDTRRRLPGTSGESLRSLTRVAQERVAHAETAMGGRIRDELARAWFAPDALQEHARLLIDEAAEIIHNEDGVSFPVRGSGTRTHWELPADGRVWSQVPAVSPRSSRLRGERYESLGYTTPRVPVTELHPAVRLRVVAEGDVRAARVTDAAETWEQEFERSRSGWVTVLRASRVPQSGDGPLQLHFDPPVRLTRIFVERPDGGRLAPVGRVTSFEATREGLALKAALRVAGGPASVELLRDGPDGLHAVWSGRFEAGDHTVAFPTEAVGGTGAITLRWGFTGWRRSAGQELTGHEVARARGLGALADGRGVVALEGGLVLLDWEQDAAIPASYPQDHRHDPAREFSFVDLGDGSALVRGADGPTGGWAFRWNVALDRWEPVDPGPEAGTVVRSGLSDLAWLKGGHLFERRGEETVEAPLDATGTLLALDSAGQPIVRLPSGEAIRAMRGGGLGPRIEGRVLAADGTGTALRLEQLNARHPEIATGFTVTRHFVGGGEDGPWRIDVSPSPVLDPPVEIAVTPDGRLLVRGAPPSWRVEPEHDWSGAVVEAWDPVWAGEIRVESP